MVIQAGGVTLSLGGTDILHGVDLAVPAGQSVALLGPSGSGKSSLMAVLSGLERATGGQVRVAGLDFTKLGEDSLARARRGRIGVVLQAFHLLPTMTARENVAVPMELAGSADAWARAEAELEAVGLGPPPGPHARPAVGRRATAGRHSPRAGAPAQPWCSPTSPPAIWTAPRARRSWTCSSPATRQQVRR